MDWQPVFSAFIQLFIVGLITAFAPPLIAYLKARAADYLQDYNTDLDYLKEIADIVVNAAEQANVAGLIKDKRKYAFDVAEAYLSKKGLDFDIDVIYAAIESAVKKSFHPEPKT